MNSGLEVSEQDLGGKKLVTQKQQNQFTGKDILEQLELKYSPNNTQDIQELQMILLNILAYPSEALAELHQQSNKLGNYDEQDEKEESAIAKKQAIIDENKQAQYCTCCGYIKQEHSLKLCTPIDDISNIGISTFLYFQTLVNLAILLGILSVVYSIYAIVTNVVASIADDKSSIQLSYLTISLGSKLQVISDQNALFYFIQCWLGIIVIIIWFFTFLFFRYLEKGKQIMVDMETKSASDFSIVMEGLPTDTTKEQLQSQLDIYYGTINNIPAKQKKPLIIQKCNKGTPFYLNESQFQTQELDLIDKQITQNIDIFANWIIQRQDSSTFSTTKQQRQQQYKKYDQLLKKKNQLLTQAMKKVQLSLKQSNVKQVTTFFITFSTNYAKDMICKLNPTDIASLIRYYITCCQLQNKFQFEKNDEKVSLKIQRAPQPEDVKWNNLGVPDSEVYKRKFITYTVTIILLGVSFAAVYGLTQAQNSTSNRYLAIVISLVVTLINVAIGLAIRKMTIMEKDYTETKHQASLALKSVLAMLINSILVPLITYSVIRRDADRIYGPTGLSDNIFWLGITNSFVTPLVKIIDPNFIFTRIIAWWKSRTNSKLYLNQNDINALHEYLFFEVGYEYIYLVNLFLFVCFYVSIQPIISLFGIFGYLLMFWTQKYSLFHRMKRPVPGTDLINVAMYQLIYLGPLMYSLGSLTWSRFLAQNPEDALLPNLIAVGLSIFMIVFPHGVLSSLIFDEQIQPCLIYQENRIYFPSEYDRMNPSTSSEGFAQYMQFVKKTQQKLKNASKQEQQEMAKKFNDNSKRGTQRMSNNNSFRNKQMISNLIAPPPTINTALLGQQLIPNNHNQNALNNLISIQQQPPQQQQPQQQQPPQQQQQQMPNMNNMHQNPQIPNLPVRNNYGFQNHQFPPQFGFQPQQQFGFQQPPQQFGFQPQGQQQFGFQQPPQQFGFQPQGQQQFGFQPRTNVPYNPYTNL